VTKALAVGIAVAVAMPLALVASSPRASASSRGRSTLLAVLPEIGSLYVGEGCPRPAQHGHSLGFQGDKMGQSGEATFRAGKRTGRRQFQPGERVWLPCVTHRVESLAVVAAGENGAVVGTARIDFGPPQRRYDPPQLTLRLYPRRPWGDPRLERFFVLKTSRFKLPRG